MHVALTHFSKPYHSHNIIGKTIGTIGKFSTYFFKKSVFSIETLFNYTQDIVV